MDTEERPFVKAWCSEGLAQWSRRKALVKAWRSGHEERPLVKVW